MPQTPQIVTDRASLVRKVVEMHRRRWSRAQCHRLRQAARVGVVAAAALRGGKVVADHNQPHDAKHIQAREIVIGEQTDSVIQFFGRIRLVFAGNVSVERGLKGVDHLGRGESTSGAQTPINCSTLPLPQPPVSHGDVQRALAYS